MQQPLQLDERRLLLALAHLLQRKLRVVEDFGGLLGKDAGDLRIERRGLRSRSRRLAARFSRATAMASGAAASASSERSKSGGCRPIFLLRGETVGHLLDLLGSGAQHVQSCARQP